MYSLVMFCVCGSQFLSSSSPVTNQALKEERERFDKQRCVHHHGCMYWKCSYFMCCFEVIQLSSGSEQCVCMCVCL